MQNLSVSFIFQRECRMKIEHVLFPSVFFKITDPFDGRSFLMCSYDSFFGTNKNRNLKNGSCEQALWPNSAKFYENKCFHANRCYLKQNCLIKPELSLNISIDQLTLRGAIDFWDSIINNRYSYISLHGITTEGLIKYHRSTQNVFNTYSMKQPDLYFETIKMTSQA